MYRQTLIHLHSSAQYTADNAIKLKPGEIAVRHAEDAENSELAILDNEGEVVYIPSLVKVTGLTDAASQAAAAAKAVADANAGEISTIKSTYATKTELSSASGALNTAIGKKVDQTAYDTKVVSLENKDTEMNAAIVALQSTTSDHATQITHLTSNVSNLTIDVTKLQNIVGVGASGDSLSTRVEALEETVSGLTTDVTDHGSRISGLETKSHTHSNKTVLDSITATKVSAWNAAENNAYTAATANTKMVVDTAKADLQGQIDEADEAIDGIDVRVAALEGAEHITSAQTDTKIATAIQALDSTPSGSSTYVTVKLTQVDGKVTGVTVTDNNEFTNLATNVSGLGTKVDAIIGGDENMSMRTVAADEAAKAIATIMSEDGSVVDEKFDTLQEIAKWITGDATGTTAADLITDIESLKTSASTNTTAIAAVGDRVTALENFKNSSAATKTDVSNAQSSAITTAKNYTDEVKTNLQVSINTNVSGISTNAKAIEAVESVANSAVQTINVTNGGENGNGITAIKSDTVYTFNFDSMVINCGEY